MEIFSERKNLLEKQAKFDAKKVKKIILKGNETLEDKLKEMNIIE